MEGRIVVVLALLCQLPCVWIVTAQPEPVKDSEFENLMPHCSKKYENLKEGNFTSHGMGFLRKEKYFPDQRCGWEIVSPEAVADIHVTFHYFDLAYNKRCDKYDHVHVYKRDFGAPAWVRISPAYGYCGYIRPFTIPAKAKRVFVRFDSDTIDLDNGRGFNTSFEIKVSQAKPRIRCIRRVGLETCPKVWEVNVEEDEVVTIQCEKDGLPNPTVEWQKVIRPVNVTNGNDTYEPIRADLVKTRISNGSIQFHNIRMSDAGEYMCNATNKLDSTQGVFRLVVTRKCLCPLTVKVFWYDNPPYTRYTEKGYTPDTGCNKGIPGADNCYKGIMYTVMHDMIQEVCGKCNMVVISDFL